MATFGKRCSWNPAQSIKVRHFLSACWKQDKALLNGSKLVIALRRAIEYPKIQKWCISVWQIPEKMAKIKNLVKP